MNDSGIDSRGSAIFGAVVAALASAVGAVIQLTHDAGDDTKVQGFVEHLALVMFSLLLVAMIPPVTYLARRVARDNRPAIVFTTAAIALAILGTISNVNGDDPSFFPFVAAPSILAILTSFVWIAVLGRRTGLAPGWVLIGLPLVIVVSIPLSAIGGGLLAAIYWVAVANWIGSAAEPVPEPAAP